jgi:RNA polymerase sigma factor (sigma-70 family)
VRAIPGTLQDGGASFRTTHWSVIADCTLAGENGSEALAQLCRDYWPPLYSFVRRRGYSPSDAQDLVQGFFASFLENKAYAQTDPKKGKFRSFLLVSVKHYITNEWDRERSSKRGGDYEFVLLEEEMEAAETLYENQPSAPILDDEHHYEQCWAAALVSCALRRLGTEFAEGGKVRLFRELKPFLCGGVGLPSQEKIAQRLEIPINTLRSHLSRVRARYGELLREEVARTIGKGDDLDEELSHFRRILTEC